MLKLAGEKLAGQLADHEADLSAHTYELGGKLRTGEYCGFRAGAGTAVPLVAKRG